MFCLFCLLLQVMSPEAYALYFSIPRRSQREIGHIFCVPCLFRDIHASSLCSWRLRTQLLLPTTTMPRTSNKKQALKDIEYAAQVIAGYIALSRSHKRKELWKYLKVLFNTHVLIQSNRYLSRSFDGMC